MRMKRIVVLIPLLVPPPAGADPVFITDGATHDVGTPTTASYDVQNGTLNILPGGVIQAVAGSGSGALITMSGGQVGGIDVTSGNLDISGGQSSGQGGSAFGGDGVNIFQSTARITGGTFTGGNSNVQAGSGVVASAGTADNLPVLSTLSIAGGTFVGGRGAGGYYGGTSGYSLLSLGDTTVSGGHFLSPIAINTAYGGETDFLGTGLTYQDNVLSGILQNGDSIAVRVYGPFQNAMVNDPGTRVRFFTAVPEPGSALVLGLMTTLGLASRRWNPARRGVLPRRDVGTAGLGAARPPHFGSDPPLCDRLARGSPSPSTNPCRQLG
jgi:hypothetical protein